MKKLIIFTCLNLVFSNVIAEDIIIEDFFTNDNEIIEVESKLLNINKNDLTEYMNAYIKYKISQKDSDLKYELEKISNICYKFNKENKINLKNCYNGNINNDVLNSINYKIENYIKTSKN